MITAGIDAGSKFTKVIILNDNSILSWASVLSGFDQEKSAEEALDIALEKAKITREDIKHMTATGAGMEAIFFLLTIKLQQSLLMVVERTFYFLLPEL